MSYLRLTERIEAVVRRRAPTGVPPLRVPGRRVYILPTRIGALFGVLLITMLIGATNYGNNLAFALTFWLGAVALVSMHRAHRNLANLRLETVNTRPVFAGERTVYTVRLASDARLTRRGLRVLVDDGQTHEKAVWVSRDFPADVDVVVVATHRGWQRCQSLRIESRYPMGLFCCWTRLAPTVSMLVYPRPIGDPAAPIDTLAREDAAAERDRGEADFAGHRGYQPGDSPRRVDWKASARSDRLLITEHADTRLPTIWFDYDALQGRPREARLSQLALWIVRADRSGAPYGLRLPSESFGPASGSAYRHTCLKALALF